MVSSRDIKSASGRLKKFYDGSAASREGKPGDASAVALKRASSGATKASRDSAGTLKRALSRVRKPPEIASVVFATPEQERFSKSWNKEMKKKIGGNPVGREVLSYVGGDLPPVALIDDHEKKRLASHHAYQNKISLNTSWMLKEIRHHDPGAPVEKSPEAVARYLNDNPKIREKITDAYQGVMVHELTHNAQMHAFKKDVIKNLHVIEAEQHAFTLQAKYSLAEMERNSRYLRSDSPISRFERKNMRKALGDYDQHMRDIPTRKSYSKLVSAEEKREKLTQSREEKTPERDREIAALKKNEEFYGRFFEQEKGEWPKKRVSGLVLLAEREAQTNPHTAVSELILAKSDPSFDDAPEPLRRQFDKTADSALSAELNSHRTQTAGKLRSGELLDFERRRLVGAYSNLERPIPAELYQSQERQGLRARTRVR